MRNRTKNTCARCGGNISYDGFCSDETCPFSDYKQNDGRGWSGHPVRDCEDDYDDPLLYLDDPHVGDH